MIFMSIKKYFLATMVFTVLHSIAVCQSTPAGSGNASAASKDAATPVNYYTGIPAISIPIHSYSNHNGLSLDVSLDYFAGGIKVNDLPSSSGLGWNLSTAGVITRTVRGMPDDCESLGFLYHTSVPSDPRGDIAEYHKTCIDGEQDIFQFNFAGRSGKFYIGRDSSIFLAPLSKIKITVIKRIIEDESTTPYTEPKEQYEKLQASLFGTINGFIITTEDGTKYFFQEKETQFTYINKCDQNASYPLMKYAGAWYLTKIMAPMANDSIQIAYKRLPAGSPEYRSQHASIVNGITYHSDTSNVSSGVAAPDGIISVNKVTSEIVFPDNKKLTFLYSGMGQFRFGTNPLLRRIKIEDSVFRYGYMLNWDTTSYGANSHSFLNGLDQYTATTLKQGYRFMYNGPFFKVVNDASINFSNKKDHWGYYNGANNSRDYVPTVAGVYNGANRTPNALAIASSLSAIKDPTGGITYYDFENNDVYPLQHTKQSISVNAATITQTAISIAKVLGAKTYFKLNLDLANTDLTTMPIAGNGDLIVNITDASGSIIYASNTLSLQNLYYTGKASFACTVPTGNYLLKTNLGAGTTCSIGLPVQIGWYTQANIVGNASISAGLRIKQIRHYDPFTSKTDTLSTFKYCMDNGKSAGFISTTPVYDYDLYSSTPSNKRFILSNVLNELDYSQGSTVGYSRVEIYKGTIANNLGKQVYEYTGIADEGYDNSPAEYPYMYTNKKEWTWGLPKKVTIYDNTGRLIQSTKNIFTGITATTAGNINYRSIKTGQVSDYYAGYNYTLNFKDYRSEKYYPESGRIDLVSSLDTFYHLNNSITTSKKDMLYDTNYNVIKLTTPYDINRNLNVERRMYYPYNYTLDGVIGKLRDSGIFVPVSTETWVVGDATPRLLSMSATDFDDVAVTGTIRSRPNIKPVKTFALQTNKPIPQSQIGLFNPSILIRDTTKIKQQQNIQYNTKGRVIQTTSLPGNISSSIIYGYNGTRAIAQVSNATAVDVAYTSFETQNEGNWYTTSTSYDSTMAITGRNSYNLSLGQIQSGTLDAAKTYMVTYWTRGSAGINGFGNNNTILEQRNGWKLYSQTFTGLTNVTITGYDLIDELRLHPKDANMATTCYEPTGEVSCTCDANNNIMYNEYDILKRPLLIRNKDKNIIKKYDYSDTYQTITQAQLWQATGDPLFCDRDSNNNSHGVLNRREIDNNPYSETYSTIREVFDHYDTLACPFPIIGCGTDPWKKSINGVCETGCKVVTASVYKKVNLGGATFGFRWVCTYHYLWSDGSVSIDYTEIGTSSCPLGGPCIN
jgi:hypothetical protein